MEFLNFKINPQRIPSCKYQAVIIQILYQQFSLICIKIIPQKQVYKNQKLTHKGNKKYLSGFGYEHGITAFFCFKIIFNIIFKRRFDLEIKTGYAENHLLSLHKYQIFPAVN